MLKPIKPKNYKLFIDGKKHLSRGLDLAANPHNGVVLGDVLLVLDSALEETKPSLEDEDEEETIS